MNQPVQVDAQDIIRHLSNQVAELSAELAMARATVDALTRPATEEATPGEAATDGP